MPKTVQTYDGEKITIRYDAVRCIHAAECVHGLKSVFNPDNRPWVDPSAASADVIAETIHRCPTGALTYERRDGGSAEPTPSRNVVWVIPHGPLHIRGDVRLTGEHAKESETRVSLCRCGKSGNKPFCDGSHEKIDFKDGGSLGTSSLSEGRSTEPRGPLDVTPAADGPLLLSGPFEIADSDFRRRCHGSKAALCRCGESKNKPFCDGSHKGAGFKG
jgi:CDGSH-type Zn-finger protein/uncharacterized Fe-S cluster protein YjdI